MLGIFTAVHWGRSHCLRGRHAREPDGTGSMSCADLGDALVLVLDVDAVAGAALAGVLQPGVTRVLVHALLVAQRSALRTLIDVHTLLPVLSQAQPRPARNLESCTLFGSLSVGRQACDLCGLHHSDSQPCF